MAGHGDLQDDAVSLIEHSKMEEESDRSSEAPRSRAKWLIPLAFTAGVAAYFSSGHRRSFRAGAHSLVGLAAMQQRTLQDSPAPVLPGPPGLPAVPPFAAPGVVASTPAEFQPGASAGQGGEGTSLFCFMAVLPGSHEEGLKQEAERRGGSIFACDAHAVYASSHAQMVHQGTWNSFANTDSFVQVWRNVFNDNTYSQHDWTVKVDPDTVFFPERLRDHLRNLHAPADKAVYIKNCNVNFGFLGAIEVVSRPAVQILSSEIEGCRSADPGLNGEDGFIKSCMDAHGIQAMSDESILRTPNEAGPCVDGSRVAFHPHKDPGSWGACSDQASR